MLMERVENMTSANSTLLIQLQFNYFANLV
jgi:hypothetical protein